jgi:catechol 2,3-dioxygenase-like lactoylglutathione lyase family enzyme
MTRDFSPVLAVADPVRALDWFADLPGVTVDHHAGIVQCGTLQICVTARATQVPGFRPLPFDHLALRVDDVDATLAHMHAIGATLHPGFTPDGPREIPAFGATGVRYAFVIGPEGAPVEFCAPRGTASGRAGCTGLDHLGLRTLDIGATCEAILARGAEERARHLLPAAPRPVEVRFLVERNLIWEAFDEAPSGPGTRTDPSLGWIGIAVRDGA